MSVRTGAENLIFWGAGATVTAGQRTTDGQTKFIAPLVKRSETLASRVKLALEPRDTSIPKNWHDALIDLLLILGDVEDDQDDNQLAKASPSPWLISEEARSAMARNWTSNASQDIENRIHQLRRTYDWPSLKQVIRSCPGIDNGRFNLTDLLNMLDMHQISGHGFHVAQQQFLTPQSVVGARNMLRMLLTTMMYIDYHVALDGSNQGLKTMNEVAEAFTRYQQREGLRLANDEKKGLDTREFYFADTAFACLNYDPIGLWAQFAANMKLNKQANVPHVSHPTGPAVPMKHFHDMGHFMTLRKPEPHETKDQDKQGFWFPMNESAVQRLNDRDHNTERIIRISKYIFPHGCLCWRECPSCGKLSAFMGDTRDFESKSLIPTPPLRAFARPGAAPSQHAPDAEKQAIARGEVDARACVHCHELTYAEHTQTIMQSNLKGTPPPYIEEMQRDLRVAIQSAGHIILMGYSLAPDDVTYRALLSARKSHPRNGKDPVKCTVIVDHSFGDRWHGTDDLKSILDEKSVEREATRKTLQSAIDIFGEGNVRFYGGGIPNVFQDAGTATISRWETILNWKS